MAISADLDDLIGKEPAWNRIVMDFRMGLATAVLGGLSCFVGALEILKPDHRTLYLFWGILLSCAAYFSSREIDRKLGMVFLKEDAARAAFGPEALRAITDVNRENVIAEARRAMFCAWAAMFGLWATLQEIAVAVRTGRQAGAFFDGDVLSSTVGVIAGLLLVGSFAVAAVKNGKSAWVTAKELLVYKL